MVKKVPISQLKSGDKLAHPIVKDGRVLIEKGRVLKQEQIIKLQKLWKLQCEVAISIEEKSPTQSKTAKLDQFAKECKYSLPSVGIRKIKDLYNVGSENSLRERLEELTTVIDVMIKTVDVSRPLEVCLGKYSTSDAHTSEAHFLRMAEISLYLAKKYNEKRTIWRQVNLKVVAQTALLFGYVWNPSFDRQKFIETHLDQLSSISGLMNQYGFVSHWWDSPELLGHSALYGCLYLILEGKIPSEVAMALLSAGLYDNVMGMILDNSQKIATIAKIVRTAAAYDSCLASIIQLETAPAENLVAALMEKINEGSIHEEMVNLLMGSVCLYPKGIKVLLSNGLQAVVQDNNPGLPTRPVLQLLEGQKVDLSQETHLTIKKWLVETPDHDLVDAIIKRQIGGNNQ